MGHEGIAVSGEQESQPNPAKHGRRWTDEQKARMSEKCLGRVVSQETRDRIKATHAAKRAARLAAPTATPLRSQEELRKLKWEYTEAQQRVALLAQQVVAARGAVESAYGEVDRAEDALGGLGDESLMAQSEVYRLKCQLLQAGVDPSVVIPPKLGDGLKARVTALHLRDDDAADHPRG